MGKKTLNFYDFMQSSKKYQKEKRERNFPNNMKRHQFCYRKVALFKKEKLSMDFSRYSQIARCWNPCTLALFNKNLLISKLQISNKSKTIKFLFSWLIKTIQFCFPFLRMYRGCTKIMSH